MTPTNRSVSSVLKSFGLFQAEHLFFVKLWKNGDFAKNGVIGVNSEKAYSTGDVPMLCPVILWWTPCGGYFEGILYVTTNVHFDHLTESDTKQQI